MSKEIKLCSKKKVTKLEKCIFLSYVLGFYAVALIKSPVVFYLLLDNIMSLLLNLCAKLIISKSQCKD